MVEVGLEGPALSPEVSQKLLMRAGTGSLTFSTFILSSSLDFFWHQGLIWCLSMQQLRPLGLSEKGPGGPRNWGLVASFGCILGPPGWAVQVKKPLGPGCEESGKLGSQ